MSKLADPLAGYTPAMCAALKTASASLLVLVNGAYTPMALNRAGAAPATIRALIERKTLRRNDAQSVSITPFGLKMAFKIFAREAYFAKMSKKTAA